MKLYIYFVIGCILAFISVNYVNADCTYLNNATAYYSFDSDVNDISGNNYNGTNYFTTSTTGILNNARSFDGSTSYIDYSTSNILPTGTNYFTVNFWLNMQKTFNDGDYNIIALHKQDTQFFSDIVRTGASYFLNFGFRGTNQVVKYTIPYDDYFNSWQMITFIYNGGAKNSANSYELYINGVLYTTAKTLVSIGGSGTNNFLGKDNGASGYLQGYIDEYSIYNYPLSTTDLSNLYNNNKSCNPYTTITEVNLETNIINNSLYNSNPLLIYYNISNFENNNQCKINIVANPYTSGELNVTTFDYNITSNELISIVTTNRENNYDINFYCNDSTNTLNKTYNIFIDTKKPIIKTNFLNDTTFNYPNVLFNLSVNVTGTPTLNKFNVSIFNETNLIYLDSLLLNTSIYQYLKEINLSYNNIGNYSLVINVFDNSSNLNSNYYNFEILPNNIPYISSYTDLINTSNSENINVYIVCEDTEQIDLITYIEWYINNINYINDSKITTSGTNETFILLSGYLSENNEVYFETYCYDYLNYSNITTSSIDYIFSVSGLETKLLTDIKNEIVNLGGYINMIVIGLIILTFIIGGIIAKKYELWLISGIMLGIVGAFYKISVNADYSDWILIVSIISGVIICIMGIAFSIMEHSNMNTEEKINKSFYKNIYNK